MTLSRGSWRGLVAGALVVMSLLQPAAFALANVRHERTRRQIIDRRSPCLASRPLFDAYGWPVKPFDKPHPIRGNFGDPRTNFFENLHGGQGALGEFRFHNGIDISAHDGTAVYAVVGGRVADVSADEVTVATYDERRFQYWHIAPVVLPGQAVTADRTILGHILPRLGHVHLTEIDRRHVVNPLHPGHVFPYRDQKPPSVDRLIVSDDRGRLLFGQTVADTITLSAAAHDLPSIAPPGHWHDAVVAPATLSWWLTGPTGSIVRGPTTVFDVRYTLPPRRAFWQVYAPSTFQNFPVSAGHHLELTGNYVFHLTELNTESLPNGLYTLTVQATDICDNAGTLTATVQVANNPDDRHSQPRRVAHSLRGIGPEPRHR